MWLWSEMGLSLGGWCLEFVDECEVCVWWIPLVFIWLSCKRPDITSPSQSKGAFAWVGLDSIALAISEIPVREEPSGVVVV